MDNDTRKFKPLKHLRYPLTPYQLFTPVSTVFLDNLTYEEQLLGLYKLYNEFITEYNKIVKVIQELQELVDTLPGRMDQLESDMSALQLAFDVLEKNINDRMNELAGAINSELEKKLQEAKDYADDKIADALENIHGSYGGGYMYGGITAAEYDALNYTATDYEALDMTAFEYDTKFKYYLYGEDGTIYLNFKETVTGSALETIFDLANPPVKLGRRYQVEISLGNFTGGTNGIAHLEIVGENTLGSTLPINVPQAGFASVVIIPTTAAPTAIRVASGETAITGGNAYIKIKPLGEK